MNASRIWIAIAVLGFCHLGSLFVFAPGLEVRLASLVSVATFVWLARVQTERLFVHVVLVLAIAFVLNATFTIASLWAATEELTVHYRNVAHWATPQQLLVLQSIGLFCVAILGSAVGRATRALAA